MQTGLYGKIKERKGEWLTGVNTQNVIYLLIVATTHKTKQRCVRRYGHRRILIIGNARRRVRRVLIMGKARRPKDVQGEQFSRLTLPYHIY